MQACGKTNVPCGKCGRPAELLQWPEVRGDLQPEHKRLLLKGDFFAAQCSFCDKKFTYFYPLFYRDAARRLMIFFDPEETRREVFYPEAVEPHRKGGYALRLASSPEALAEAIALFDAGISDKALALLKAAQLPRAQASFPGRGIDALRYAPRQSTPQQSMPQQSAPRQSEKYLYLDAYAGGRRLNRLALPMREYEEIYRRVKPYLHMKENAGRYLRIDEGWTQTAAGKFFQKKASFL